MTYYDKDNTLKPEYTTRDIYTLRLMVLFTFSFFPVGIMTIFKFFNYSLEGDIQSKWEYIVLLAGFVVYILAAMPIFYFFSRFLVNISFMIYNFFKSNINSK